MKGRFCIRIYQTKKGREPFIDWITKFDNNIQDKIMQRISRLQVGNFGDCKLLGKKIYELRFFFASGYRIYLAKEHKNIIILLCAGDKSTQNKDIKKAQEFYKDYKNG